MTASSRFTALAVLLIAAATAHGQTATEIVAELLATLLSQMGMRWDNLATRLGWLVFDWGFVLMLAAFVLYVSSGYVKQMAGLDARSQNAGIPMWIPHSAILIGFGLIAVLAILQFIQLWRKGEGP